MQYIQLQGQIAADLDLPIEGSYNLFIDTSDNSIKAKDSDGHMHGGGGLSLTELTRDEIGQLVVSASLTPGAFYKINGAASRSFLDANGIGYNSWTDGGGNEIQDGGTTIILQATSDKTLSKKGIGLFYVPNYEDPNNPTAPPDYNYTTWDNTHRIYVQNVVGRFYNNEYVQLYSNETSTSTYAYLEGSLYDSGSYGALTFRLENGNDHFFDNSNNFIGLTITGQNSGATCEYSGTDYITSYFSGSCVVYGGRVWGNISGNIGSKTGGWPDSDLRLTSNDWVKVPFDEVHYTLVANEIEYEFDKDNISYRNDGRNEVFSDWKWWDDNWGYNMIKFFPWGHKQVERVSISNSYLASFVNFPYDATAWNIKFEDGGGFNAHTWGKRSQFYDIQGEKGAHFVGHDFANGTNIYTIKLGVNSYMSGINTYDNSYGNYSQIYDITLGVNAQFGDFTMYYGSYIEYVDVDNNADLQYFTMYEYSRIRNVKSELNSYFGSFNLWNGAEIKYVKLGINSYIQYFDLYYSSCLKRTTLGNDSYMQYFDLGVNSFIRQVNLSERAYISNFTIGDYSNLQNIDLGAYSYMQNFDGGYHTDFQNIRLDARANVYDIHLGYDSTFSEIQIAPNSSFYSVNNNNYPSPFTGSYVGGITIQPYSNINNLTIGSNASISDFHLGTNAYFGSITLEENAYISDINIVGDSENGNITINSGSYISNFTIGMNAGIGLFTVSSSAFLNNFTIGDNSSFGSNTFTSSLYDITISKGFNNFKANELVSGVTGSLGWADRAIMGQLDPSKSFQILDTTGWDASTDSLNFYLPNGQYDGQTIKFFMTTNGTNINGNVGNLKVWVDNIAPSYNVTSNYTNYPWYPFSQNSSYGTIRVDIPQCIWINGKWVIDNDSWD